MDPNVAVSVNDTSFPINIDSGLEMRDFKRLNAFLDERLKDIYPEPMGNLAENIIDQME